MLAAIEPWHGHQVVVYSPPEGDGLWHRHVIDDTLQEGHALVTADFDGDGQDEIVAGWRAGGGGLRLYKATDATGREFKTYDLDPGMPAEGAVAADINGDGKLDLVVIGGRKNQLAWYENTTTGQREGRRRRGTLGNDILQGVALVSVIQLLNLTLPFRSHVARNWAWPRNGEGLPS